MIICSTNVLWMVLILLKQRVGFYKMQNGFFKINFFMLIIYILLKKETLRGHPFSTYTIFCKKMTPPPHPPWYTRTFCNTPSHCVRTNLLYPPPPSSFSVKSNFSFKLLSDLGMQLTIFQKIIHFSIFSLHFSYLQQSNIF